MQTGGVRTASRSWVSQRGECQCRRTRASPPTQPQDAAMCSSMRTSTASALGDCQARIHGRRTRRTHTTKLVGGRVGERASGRASGKGVGGRAGEWEGGRKSRSSGGRAGRWAGEREDGRESGRVERLASRWAGEWAGTRCVVAQHDTRRRRARRANVLCASANDAYSEHGHNDQWSADASYHLTARIRQARTRNFAADERMADTQAKGGQGEC